MNIDFKQLEKVCLSKISYFESFGKVTNTKDGIYIKCDNPKSKILGVAHLDTVKNRKFFHYKKKKGDIKVYSPQLDDRLGVYTLMYLLPQLGIEFDLLLTEGEESGRSTARHFTDSKEYNWMFSFDRRGEDVVTYDFSEKCWEEKLEESNFKIGIGSFSDIAFMEHLGIKGVNIGTGYIGEHTNNCFASINVLKRQILRFQDFYNKNKDIKYPHVEMPYWSRSSYPIMSFRYNPHYYDDLMGCYLCENGVGIEEVLDGIYLCPQCFASAGICAVCQDIVPDVDLISEVCSECRYSPFDDFALG